jgi:predicted regulator of amino acid metabolism with ACT domain
MSSSKNENKVIVTITDEALSTINEVANKLSKKGLNIEQVHAITGIIVGSSSEDKISDLKNVDGVLNVEKELTIQLPPSDDLLQE